MNIFSIPVGVTFAKEFTGDAWTVKPSLDLTLTGNFGDDKTDGTAHWAGVENLSTNVSSEVIDNFTYGATLGVAAKTGNFSLGLGDNNIARLAQRWQIWRPSQYPLRVLNQSTTRIAWNYYLI